MSYYTPPLPPPPPQAGRQAGREALAATVVALAVAVGGVLLGLLWYLLAPPLPLKKVEAGMAFITPQPEELAAQDGWFTILGFVFGVLAAVATWVLVRRWRGPWQLVALLVGAVGAGFLAWKIGTQIGQDEYRDKVASAPMGTVIDRPIELSSAKSRSCLAGRCITTPGGDIFVPALGAVIGYAVLAGWSRWPSLRREEEEQEQQRLVHGWGGSELGEVRRDGPDLP
ncbi:MAG TPA: DUF2567 domain-containing protein [Candidatus Limnocylindrales bacterium]